MQIVHHLPPIKCWSFCWDRKYLSIRTYWLRLSNNACTLCTVHGRGLRWPFLPPAICHWREFGLGSKLLSPGVLGTASEQQLCEHNPVCASHCHAVCCINCSWLMTFLQTSRNITFLQELTVHLREACDHVWAPVCINMCARPCRLHVGFKW